jgi:hypothetical protein
MEPIHFDRLTRELGLAASRRQTLRALALVFVSVAATGTGTDAGPGCKDVGKKCKKARDCCSGSCRGGKRRKRCKAHDTGGCPNFEHPGVCGGVDVPCITSTDAAGLCTITTGRAPYCAAAGTCGSCTRDADCRAAFGPRAACTWCFACPGRTRCVGP